MSSEVQTIANNAEGSDGSHRAPANSPTVGINVPAAERWGSAIAGGALLLTGLRMRTLPGALMAFLGGAMVHRGVTGHCMTYAALGVNRAEGAGAEPSEYFEHGIHVLQSVTVNKPAEELYRFWRNFENLPRIMNHLNSVNVIDEKRSRWQAKAPAGLSVQWEAEIINDVPNEKISWRSLYPASVDSAGSVQFTPAPSGRGTEVSVTLDYIPPAGKLGWAIAKVFGKDPAAEVREDLRTFKSIMEAGEAPTIDGQPHGPRSAIGALASAIG